MHTYACGQGLGAVLYQYHNEQKRVIAYASRSLSKSEKNYSAYKLDFLALKWAVTEKFSDYLTNNYFTVLTDNNPLTHILTSAKLDATGQRWASALGEFNFDIFYTPGVNNRDADGMSRYQNEKLTEDDELKKIENNVVKAICSRISVSVLEMVPCWNINIVEATENPGKPMAQLEMQEIRLSQREDNTIDRWRIAVIDKCMPVRIQTKSDQTIRKKLQSL